MIHIQKINLVDFQTHKNTTIEFSPHFNVVVGSTRSGKSSLVRALDFLLYNNWYEDYQRFGSKYAVVTATLSNGRVITRTKGTNTNKIDVTLGKEVQRFESFGTSLPAEVIALLGAAPIDIGTKDPILANVANQDDPLFLLYSTGTDRTKILSRLAGLHWLDYALKDLNKDKRTKSSEVQYLKESNEQLLTKLRAFKDLDKVRESFNMEKVSLSYLKEVEKLITVGRSLSARAVQWKRDYQEVQLLKTVDFPAEIARTQRIIDIQTNLLTPLQEISRKLIVNKQSSENIKKHISTLREDYLALNAKIEDAKLKTPTCATCGQELSNKYIGLGEQ